MTRDKISVCLMVGNEEAVIRDCLMSLSFADEIVVIDGMSNDRTVEICREFTDRVERRPFRSHVDQRRYSVSLAQNPWVFCIDADERVTPSLRSEILEAVENWDGRIQGFSVPRLTIHLGRPIRTGGWYPDRKLRLARAESLRVTGTTPHDRLEVDGPICRFDGRLLHLSYRDLSHHIEVINRYATAMAAKRRDMGKRPTWWGLGFAAPLKFLKMYIWKRGFLEGPRGLILAVIGSFYVFLRHAKQWESERLRVGDEEFVRDDSPFHKR